MALFEPGETECWICKQVVEESQAVFATMDAELDGADSVMHWSCYATWPRRGEFARAYFESLRGAIRGEYSSTIFDDGDVFVTAIVNPYNGVPSCHVALSETGSVPDIAVSDWTAWMQGKLTPASSHPVETAALERIRARLALSLPDSESVLAAAAAQSAE